jgi:hypothetical protein
MARNVEMVLWDNRPLHGVLPPRICVVDRSGGIYVPNSAGTDWTLESVYSEPHYAALNRGDAVFPLSATAIVAEIPTELAGSFYLYSLEVVMEVSITNDSSNCWAVSVRKQNGDSVGQVSTMNGDPDTVQRLTIAEASFTVNPISTTTTPVLLIKAEKVGTPGDLLYCYLVVKVRNVLV